jgi:hypothetical protein
MPDLDNVNNEASDEDASKASAAKPTPASTKSKQPAKPEQNYRKLRRGIKMQLLQPMS